VSSVVTVNWRRFAALVAILTVTLALYWPALQSLGVLWLDGARTTYTHGFLVAAISCWLVWRARAQASRRDTQAPSSLLRIVAVAALAGCAVLWQIAYRAGIQLGVELLLPPILWLAVLTMLGRNAARALLAPTAFLLFALPLWDVLNPLLQAGSIHAARLLFRLTGVPAHFSGNVVQIPAGSFEIQGGCSGLHFFVVAVAIAALLGELRHDSWRQRLRWLLLAGVLAVVVNWIRIYTVILAGHLSHMQNYLVRESHYAYGWFLFSLALLVLFLIERRTPLRDLPAVAPDAAESGAAEPLHAWRLASAVLIALPVLLNGIIAQRPASAGVAALDLPAVAGWSRADGGGARWSPVQQGADRESRLRFERDGAPLEIYRAFYGEQRLGKKLGGHANRLQGDADVIETEVAAAGGLRFASMLVELGGRQSMLWISYRVDGTNFQDATRAQLWYSWLTLRHLRSVPSGILALRAECVPDCAAARATLGRFVTDHGGRL
jgi:exosortase A